MGGSAEVKSQMALTNLAVFANDPLTRKLFQISLMTSFHLNNCSRRVQMSARDLIKIGYSQIYEQNSNARVNIFIEIIITCYCVMFTIGFNLERS